jgi:hypothetical protein
MRIPNKFNGYSRDGIRLYNDPATVGVTIASMGEGVAVAEGLGAAGLLGTTGTSMVGADVLAQSIATGVNAYNGTGLSSLINGGTPQVATAPTGIASNFNAPQYLSNLQTPAVEAAAPTWGGDVVKAIQQTPVSPVTNAATQITPTINAAPELSNLTNRFPAQFQGDVNSLAQNPVMQQRITTPSLPPVESITAPPAPAPVSAATAPVSAATAPAEVITEPVTSPLLDPSQIKTDPNFKLATSEAPAVTEGELKSVVKPGMTGNAYDDAKTLFSKPNWQNIKDFASEHPYLTAGAGLGAYQLLKPKALEEKKTPANIRPYTNTRAVSPTANYYTPYSGASTAERNYFTGGLQALPIYQAAEGGLTSLAVGGPIETMSAMNAVGENLGYPQSQYQTDIYSNPNVQRPQATNMIGSESDVSVDQYTGEEKFADGGSTGEYKYSYDPKSQQFTQLSNPVAEVMQQPAQTFTSIGTRFQPQSRAAATSFTPVTSSGITTPAVQSTQPMQVPVQQAAAPAQIPAYQTPEQQLGLGGFYDYMNQQLGGMRGYQGFAEGGLSHLGGYSDGGRLLRGPGDGVSDSIPASIGDRQPARLADGEFVVPARVVSEIGNGSTEAGARKLYAMMERVQNARKKSVGKGNVAVNSKADKYLPA